MYFDSSSITLKFRQSGEYSQSPIIIQCSPEDKIPEIIQMYRRKCGDYDEFKKFIFNAKALNPNLTVAEAGLTNNANIFVIKTKSLISNTLSSITLKFRQSGEYSQSPIIIQCSPEDKIPEIIQKYRRKCGDYDEFNKFIFNAKELNPNLTVAEAGLTDNANIFVIKTTPIKPLNLPLPNNSDIKYYESKLNRLEQIIEERNNTISNLNKELSKAKEIIKAKDYKINELEKKLNYIKEESDYNSAQRISKIEILEKQLKEKDFQLKNLRNNNLNIKDEKIIKESQIAVINFSSLDQKVHYAISCANSTIFAEIEEKLYKIYPEYRETNNTFIAKGKTILRFKTVGENGIGDGFPVILYPPN